MCLLNLTWAAYKTTNSYHSLTVLLTIACISYLALEEGSPLFKQINPFYLSGISTFIHTTNRISFDFLS